MSLGGKKVAARHAVGRRERVLQVGVEEGADVSRPVDEAVDRPVPATRRADHHGLQRRVRPPDEEPAGIEGETVVVRRYVDIGRLDTMERRVQGVPTVRLDYELVGERV